MGRRQRGQDQIDVQRRADKKRRQAFKAKQKNLAKELRDKVSDEAATSESIQADLAKLDGFKQLSAEQKQLKESLSEKLVAVLELEKMRAEFEKERQERRARGERTSDEDDDDDGGESEYDDDDDDDDDDGSPGADEVGGPRKPPAPATTVTLDDSDPWAELLKAEEEEEEKRASAAVSSAATAETKFSAAPKFSEYRPDLAAKQKQERQQQKTDARNNAAMAAFMPISRMVAAGDAKRGDDGGDEDPELSAFLQSLDQ